MSTSVAPSVGDAAARTTSSSLFGINVVRGLFGRFFGNANQPSGAAPTQESMGGRVCKNFGKLPFKIKLELSGTIIGTVISCVAVGKIIGVAGAAVAVGAAASIGISIIGPVIIAVLGLGITITAVSFLVRDLAKAFEAGGKVVAKVERVQQRLGDVENKNKEQKKEIKEAEQVIKKQGEKIQVLQDANFDIQEQLDEAAEIIDKHEETLESLRQSAEDIINKIKTSTDASIAAFQENIESSKAHLDNLNGISETYRQEIASIKTDFAKEQEEILKIIEEQRTIVLEALNTPEDDANKKLEILVNAIVRAVELNGSIEARTRKLPEFLNERLDALSAKLDEKLNNLAHEIQQTRQRYEEQKRELEATRDELKRRESVWYRCMHMLGDDSQKLEEKIAQISDDLENMEADLDALEGQSNEVGGLLGNIRQRNSAINEGIRDARADVRDIGDAAREMAASGSWVATAFGAFAGAMLVGGTLYTGLIAGVTATVSNTAYHYLVSGTRNLLRRYGRKTPAATTEAPV